MPSGTGISGRTVLAVTGLSSPRQPPPSPPSPPLRAIAEAYDASAVRYAEFVRADPDGPPLDRAVIGAFAELVRATGTGPVADLGCGPGLITARLRDLGLDVFGVDVSPAMVELARAAYPELRFSSGSMDALALGDGTLGGILSWYSLIHLPPHELPAYLVEFRRLLAPGGHLLLGFFESEEDPVTAFDHRVVTAYRWPVDTLGRLAAAAGFAEVGRTLRPPEPGERFRQGRLLLRADPTPDHRETPGYRVSPT